MNKITDKKDIRIVYMGTPEISAKVLRGLIEKGYNIVALIANEDKPVGRKKELVPVPTKQVALEHDIPVYQPHRIRLENEFLKELNADLILTMAYGQIVPLEVLRCPRLGCLNLHGSLLPKYRGAAPIQRAIMDGETYSGVTLMEMVEAMDAGLMYEKKAIRIEEDDDYGSLSNKIAEASIETFDKAFFPFVNGELKGESQDESLVTFAPKISVDEEHLDVQLSPNKLVNTIKGLSPAPGGYLFCNGKKLKILKASVVVSSIKKEPGTLFIEGKQLLLACKDGAISLLRLQLEGKKECSGVDFINGHRNEILTGVILN